MSYCVLRVLNVACLREILQVKCIGGFEGSFGLTGKRIIVIVSGEGKI